MSRSASLDDEVRAFLANQRIAVAGVSRNDANAPANLIYRKLRDAGYEAFAVNPSAAGVEGDRCYPDLAAIPGGIGAVVVATHPEATTAVVRQGIALGVRHVWMHRSFGTGSVADEAVAACRDHGVHVIAGGCPMMFLQPVDIGHRCMLWCLRLTGKLPQAA